MLERLLVVHCPELSQENGVSRRAFLRVVRAVEEICPWVTPIRPGVCALPARGPARYFGGETALVDVVAGTVRSLGAGYGTAGIGIADGLFAALLAAQHGLVVPKGGTAAFLAPLPLSTLGNADLATALARLGIDTLGAFAALPARHVFGRFGTEGVAGHDIATGRSGELPGLRVHPPRARTHLRTPTEPADPDDPDRPLDPDDLDDPDRPAEPAGPISAAPESSQPGFWGGTDDAGVRARRAVERVIERIGDHGVVTTGIRGGRGPADQVRFAPWDGPGRSPRPLPTEEPWPGRLPPPAPALVHADPLPAAVVDAREEHVTVSGRGLLTMPPHRLSIAGRPWATITRWAGPWPAEERWWSGSRRRVARMQVVTGGHAYVLLTEHASWWVEATYD